MDNTNETPQGGQPDQQGAQPEGAGPGNPNVLRHGFYATGFTEEEMRWLDETSPLDFLQDEIIWTKVLLRRVFNTLDKGSPTYQDDLLNTIKVCTQAVDCLSEAIQTQRQLSQMGADPAAEFNEIIKRMVNGDDEPE